ncbi:MAG: class I SAM-dependent methyltransferase [Anaerolineae bacterium]
MQTKESKRYDRGMWLLEKFGLRQLRRDLIQQVQGRTLEVGIGTGANLPLYTGDHLVVGIDRQAARLSGAKTRGNGRPPIPLIAQTDAQLLPFPDNEFDTVVSTLVFCSIPQPALALAEIKRVLRADGRFLLLEHVRGQGKLSRRFTDWLHPAWFALQHECHLNRETAVAVQDAGFHIEQISTHGWGILQMMVAKKRKT